MDTLKHVIEFLINPFFICILLLGISLIFLWRNPHGLFIRMSLSFVFLLLIFISTGWLPKYLTRSLESQYPVIKQVDPEISWIVVLSGGQNTTPDMPANNLLSAASLKRLIEGVRLFRMLPKAQLVLSGGGLSSEIPEAIHLAQLAQWFAIPASSIVLENKSLNTAEQARNLIPLVGDKPFYLITSAAHMPRAMVLCHQQGLHPIAAPTDFTFFWNSGGWEKMIISNPYNMSYFSIALHEILGRAWARLQLNTH